MIDHVSLGVTDLERSKAFYDAVLKPLGVSRFYDYEGGLGYGTAADKVNFWIGTPFDAGRPARAGLCELGRHDRVTAQPIIPLLRDERGKRRDLRCGFGDRERYVGGTGERRRYLHVPRR